MPIIISPDLHLIDTAGTYRWSPDRATAAWDRCYEEFAEALRRSVSPAWLTIGIPGSGKSTWIERAGKTDGVGPHTVIFDATLCKRLSRRPLLEIAQQANIPLCGAVFFTPLITAMQRNAQRPFERRVPYESLSAMLKTFESEPPTLDEGFSSLIAIRPK